MQHVLEEENREGDGFAQAEGTREPKEDRSAIAGSDQKADFDSLYLLAPKWTS